MERLEPAALPAASQDKPELAPNVEERIGITTAMLAATLAVALAEHSEEGKPTRATRRRGGELVAELVGDKMTLPDFDAIARAHGRQELYRYRDTHVIPLDNEFLDMLVERSLDMLSIVLKMKAN
jgi:hypothetical protein